LRSFNSRHSFTTLRSSSFNSIKRQRWLSSTPTYSTIEELTKHLELGPTYLEKFKKEKLQVSDFSKLSSEELKELVPEMGPRSRLKAYLKALNVAVPEPAKPVSDGVNDHLHHAQTDWHTLEGANKGPPVLEIQMPEFVENCKENKLLKWLVGEGDEIQSGQAICEIETDIAVLEMQSQHHGFLGRILVKNGFVKVGKVIGVLVSQKADVSKIATQVFDYE